MPSKTFFPRGASALLVIGALAAAGCQRESGARQRSDQGERSSSPGYYDQGTGRASDRGTMNHSSESGAAIGEIVMARCDRERACNNVGEGRKFASDEACRSEIAGRTHDDLNVNDCSGEIDQKALSDCLGSIQREDCSNALDTLSQLAACRISEICRGLSR